MSEGRSVVLPAPVVADADDDAVSANADATTVFVSVFVAPESEAWPQAVAVSPITIAAASVR